MKFKTIQEIETRKAEILQEMEKEGADLNALKAEMEELRKNAQEIQQAAAQAAETRKQIAEGAAGIPASVIESQGQETGKSKVDEIRSRPEYAEAYKHYILTNDSNELRALLTVNAPANGQYPVPVVVDSIIKTAWDNDQILSRINRTYIRGNLKVPFEREADPAQIHNEGANAVTEEDLTLGIVELKPVMIKKLVRISDEVVAMGGEDFIRYIYDEITYRVIQLLADSLVGAIATAGTTHTATAIGVPEVTGAPSLTIIPTAAANLTGEARNPVVIMNRLTSADFVAARAAGNFAIDPYDGLPVLYSSALKAYSAASSGDTYAIVGDLLAAQVNYPEGDDVAIKWDDLTEAPADIVRVIGRQYVGYGVTRPGMLCNIAKA